MALSEQEKDRLDVKGFLWVYEKIGKVPTRAEYDRYKGPNMVCSQVLVKRYSWNGFIYLAGLDPTREDNWGIYNRETLISKLQELGQLLGRTPNSMDINKSSSMPSHALYCYYFGSIQESLAAAGYPSKKQVALEIGKELKAILGRAPRMREWGACVSESAPTAEAVARSFGGWKQFVKQL